MHGLLTVLIVAASVAAVRAERYEGVFDATDRVAVVERDYAGASGDGTPVDHVLYDSSAATDVESLRNALRATTRDGICGCMASIEIHLYRGDERLGTVYYLGSTLKGDLWDGDAEIGDHEALLRWFDARGIDGPRRDETESQERARADAILEARFMAAMPAALRPLWEEQRERIRQDLAFEPPATWRHALDHAYPDAVDRSAALLRWFGYGGPWSGYSSEESIAEALLLEVPVATLLAAIEESAADDAVLQGAARLVSAHDFGDARAVVPAHLRRVLLECVRAGGDVDKRERAEAALGEHP